MKKRERYECFFLNKKKKEYYKKEKKKKIEIHKANKVYKKSSKKVLSPFAESQYGHSYQHSTVRLTI